MAVDLFRKWVVNSGGAEGVARALGVTSHAVRFWLRRKGYPTIDTMRAIVKRSKGQVDYHDIIEACTPLDAKGGGNAQRG